MKFSIPFLLLLLIFSSCDTPQSSCECDALTINNQKIWVLNNEPFSGKCYSNYSDGTLESEAEFLNGRIHGHMLSYYPNGNLEEDSKWVNGVISDSTISYFKTGEVYSIAKNRNPESENINGYIYYYYKSGKLSEEGLVVENNKEGTWKVYYDNGQLMTLEKWENNLQMDSSFAYFKDGNIKSKGLFINGLHSGKWTFYDSLSGKIDGYLLYENGKAIERTKP